LKINGLKMWLILFILTLCLQNVNIITFSNFSLKLCHIVSLVFIFYLKGNYTMRFPSMKIMVFYFIIFFVSLLSYKSFGMGSLLFNYIFGFYILLILFNLKYELSKDEFYDILQKVSWIVLIIVILNAILNYQTIIRFLRNPYGHPEYNFIFAGGPNLEATWTSMLGIFSGKTNKKYIFVFLTAILSALLASRVGIIINILVLLYFLIQEKNGLKKILTFCIVILILFLLAIKTNIFSYILSRFSQTGYDSGSMGRKRMWSLFWPTLKQHPFGVGIGNSIKALERYSNLTFYENNLHNLIMQMFIELGVLGGLYYIYLIFAYFIECIKHKELSPYSMFLGIYIIIGTLQFRGGDSLFFVILGIYLIIDHNYKNKKRIIERTGE